MNATMINQLDFKSGARYGFFFHRAHPIPIANPISRAKSKSIELVGGQAASINRGANAKNKHGQGNDDNCKLNVLAVDLADGQGEGSKFCIHGGYPFCYRLKAIIGAARLQNRLQKIKKKMAVRPSLEEFFML